MSEVKNSVLKATFVFLVIAALTTATYAAYWVYSNVITVNVSDYTLTLSSATNGLQVSLTGQLLNPFGNPVNGAPIVIYRTDATGNIQETLATVYTNSTGHYTYIWQAGSAGTYYFKSGYLAGG